MSQVPRGQPRRRGPLPRLRHLADALRAAHAERLALTSTRSRIEFGPRIGALVALVLLASVARAGAAPIALADDPTPGPASETPPPTCAERFPAEGPAGVDLRLGCIVGELVGLYTARDAGPPPPLSSYAIAAGLLVVGVLVALAVAGRLVAQRAGRRLAPVLPAEWWVCGTCRSVNGAGVAHCYSCGAGRTDGPTLPTDASPEIPQSFGDRRRRG